MSAVVIDENVLIVAEKQAPDSHTNDACIRSCIQALRDARDQLIVLDAQGLIVQKYRRQLKPLQPSWLGSEFLMWLESNQFRPERCERVTITPLTRSGTLAWLMYAIRLRLIWSAARLHWSPW